MAWGDPQCLAEPAVSDCAVELLSQVLYSPFHSGKHRGLNLPELNCLLHIASFFNLPAYCTGTETEKRLHIPLVKER